jgi:hypothetical protein
MSITPAIRYVSRLNWKLKTLAAIKAICGLLFKVKNQTGNVNTGRGISAVIWRNVFKII